MVHVSEITADKHIHHPQDVLRVGQVVKAQVLEVDKAKRQLRLSMKQRTSVTVEECLAMEHGHIPPTLNCHEPCEEITPGFDLVRLKHRKQALKHILSNSFGFGGSNSSLVFGKV